MGFDDDFSAIRLFIPGGRIRPNTQAVVAGFDETNDQINMLAHKLGGFDVGFVGVNGIDADGGLTTHENSEAKNKTDIINACARTIVVGDSSKIGIVLERKFAEVSDPSVTLMVNKDPESEGLKALLDRYEKHIVLA